MFLNICKDLKSEFRKIISQISGKLDHEMKSKHLRADCLMYKKKPYTISVQIVSTYLQARYAEK